MTDDINDLELRGGFDQGIQRADHGTGEQIILDDDVAHAGQIAEFLFGDNRAKWISSCRMECDFNASMVSTATSLPWRMMPTRSQTFPLRAKHGKKEKWCGLLSCFGKQVVELMLHQRVKPLVGSSGIISSGLFIKACSRPSFCLLPRDSPGFVETGRIQTGLLVPSTYLQSSPPRKFPRYFNKSSPVISL